MRGLGTAGGVKLMIQDGAGLGYRTPQNSTEAMLEKVKQDPVFFALAYSTFGANTPQLFADVDRVRATRLDVPLDRVFETPQVYLGGAYVNDFSPFGHTYQVWVRADGGAVGAGLRSMDNNLMTQIGLVVVVGLVSKNATLIVEFAR